MSRDELFAALEALSTAHGPQALAEAHESLRRAQIRKRKREHAEYGPLATAIREGLMIREQMKREGVPDDQIAKSFETIVRDMWPKPLSGRDTPWGFLCENCEDYGGEILECPAVPCERRFAHGPHSYLRPCYCRKRRFDLTPPSPTDGDALDRAAKPTKPKKFF